MNTALMSIGVCVVVALGAAGIAARGGMATPTTTPAPNAPSGFIFKAVKDKDQELKYVVYVPRDYDAAKPMPAIVFLHGSGESGTDGQKQIAQGIGTNILWNASRWPCIVMMPQKPTDKKQWEEFDGAVMAMLAQTRAEYAVDPDRIALTGLSQGGHGTWTIGANHPEVWCALAPICGYGLWPREGKPGAASTDDAAKFRARIANKVKDIPIWCFHGEADDIVPPSESTEMIEVIKTVRLVGGQSGAASKGPEPRLTIYPKVNHGSWDRAYGEAELPGFLMRARQRTSQDK